MTLTIRRPIAVLAACAAVGAMVTGCDSGPSRVGAAAIVGDQVISLDTVQQQIADELRTQANARQLQQQGKFDLVARNIVMLSLWSELTDQMAAKDGIKVGEQQVDQAYSQELAQEKASGQQQSLSSDVSVPLQGDMLRNFVRDNLVWTQLGAKHAATVSITFDAALVPDRATAQAKANQIAADPANADTIIKSAANSQNTIVDQTGSPLNSDPTLAPLFRVPAGTVVGFQAQSSGSGWLVAYVKHRNENGTPVSGVDPQSAQSAATGYGQDMMSLYAAQVGVTINPRYGVWDPLTTGLAAADDQTSGIVVPVGNKKP